MSRIRTTHVGSLPRTDQLLAANEAKTQLARDEFEMVLQEAVDEVVKKQQDIGLGIVNEGKYGHVTTGKVDYGSWWAYSFTRLGGIELRDEARWESEKPVRSTPGNPQLTSFPDRRDWTKFKDAYADPTAGITVGKLPDKNPVVTGPVTYVGGEEAAFDIALLKHAMDRYDIADGFLAAVAPGSAARVKNEYYDSEAEYMYACADALREEYRAIVDAGLILQLDDPSLAEAWDQINPEPSFEDYRSFLQLRIDTLNHALEGIDPARVRIHLCWGSWHGPHTTDIELKHIVDKVLEINADQISFEAANVRHAHEWKVWRDIDLPENKILVPGVVSHSTNVVEHPELVAERIEKFAGIVGPERVIASTDCGLGGRIHRDIAWAKLESLVEGARLASS